MVTVRVVVKGLPRGGDSSDPLKSQDVKFEALQNSAGTVAFSFELPFNEISCKEDGRIDGNAVYALASKKLQTPGIQHVEQNQASRILTVISAR